MRPLKIVCPFVPGRLEKATEFTLKIEHPETLFVDVSDTEERYFWLCSSLWEKSETFIIVEQDIVPWPTALESIWDCEEPLCAYETPHNLGGPQGEWFNYGLGLVKYGAELMRKYPDHLSGKRHREWQHLDGELTWRFVHEYGLSIHYHFPPVIHLNPNRFEVSS